VLVVGVWAQQELLSGHGDCGDLVKAVALSAPLKQNLVTTSILLTPHISTHSWVLESTGRPSKPEIFSVG
jgi:hypothetical protein